MRQNVRRSRFASLCLIPLLPLLATQAHADDERQLAGAINSYRTHPQRCAGRGYPGLAPLALKPNLALPVGYDGGLRDGLKAAGYQAAAVQAIRVTGAPSAQAAFAQFQSEYCEDLLDNQYADIGISRAGNQWRMVLARPLLDTRLGNGRATANTLLAEVNAARARPRLCGNRPFAAARPLSWSAALGTAAQGHSRAMANGNYFAHRDPDGDTPADRAKSAGYRGRQIGENIAAGQGSPDKAMAGWLASPGHCANLMNPMFTQVGAAYAADTRSELGIYWTMMFGAP